MAAAAKYEKELRRSLETAKSTALTTYYIPYEARKLDHERTRTLYLDYASSSSTIRFTKTGENGNCPKCAAYAQQVIDAQTTILNLLEYKYALELKTDNGEALASANALVRHLNAQLKTQMLENAEFKQKQRYQAEVLREQFDDAKNEAIAAQTLYLNLIIDNYRKENERLKLELLEREHEIQRLNVELSSNPVNNYVECTYDDIYRLEKVYDMVTRLEHQFNCLQYEYSDLKQQLLHK